MPFPSATRAFAVSCNLAMSMAILLVAYLPGDYHRMPELHSSRGNASRVCGGGSGALALLGGGARHACRGRADDSADEPADRGARLRRAVGRVADDRAERGLD